MKVLVSVVYDQTSNCKPSVQVVAGSNDASLTEEEALEVAVAYFLNECRKDGHIHNHTITLLP